MFSSGSNRCSTILGDSLNKNPHLCFRMTLDPGISPRDPPFIGSSAADLQPSADGGAYLEHRVGADDAPHSQQAHALVRPDLGLLAANWRQRGRMTNRNRMEVIPMVPNRRLITFISD